MQPPDENIGEYKYKKSVTKNTSSANKRLKTTTKTTKADKTNAGDMIHSMDVDITDNTDMQTTATTAQDQSDIKINESVSALAMTSVNIKQKDEDTLVNALK